ncbi:hypothetical protein FOIG_09187 [Fusarium odoratissimum NRRL 54006]|uniref:DUF6546 domain-containing protein n=1 Tax=Fusarium odoratissimum (strain NRRL 54006) TaxID=1089451 RepID=X0KNK0_FUSO5|nr:uncharacterized protein FOIG_09187 [Fusarium odoratissimum NRRL 54006]EXL98379.1 hypothetical protein FOIG_09187 [Fusarium odoratissimum NRRL 54006]
MACPYCTEESQPTGVEQSIRRGPENDRSAEAHHRRIHLNIELPSYACRRSKLIKKALRKLSGALETWEPTDRITLELNVYSPSDPDHWFKNHLYGFNHEDDGNLLEKQKTWDDPKHGWVKGKQVTLPNAASILQLFKTISPEIAAGAKPAQVPAVKGIVIRRQMRRRINPLTLCILLERFPNAESIDYEPWRVLCHSLDENGSIYGRHDLMMQVLLRKLPQHVRSVTIFEDFNEQIMEAIRNDMDPSIISMSMQIETRRFTRSELGEAFAVKSRDLEHLSVAFMIDARDFLRSCKMLSDWPRLRSLILTAPIMTKGSRDSISGLLVNAGEVAQQMLHLKSLAIWHCSHEKACAVIFHKNEREDRNGHDSATLTWRGTRDFDFSKEVVETWQKVVCTCNSHQGCFGQCDSHQLLFRIERVEDEIISHGDAIHHLRLPDGVIDPTSLRQIRQEGTLQREAWAVEAEPSGWT